MLVLTRKCGQKLLIGEDIVVTVLETRGDTVKIGIQAPRNISIFREELLEEIKKANAMSMEPSHGSPDALEHLSQWVNKPPKWKT